MKSSFMRRTVAAGLNRALAVTATIALALGGVALGATAAMAVNQINAGVWSGIPVSPLTTANFSGTVTSSAVTYPNGTTLTADTGGKTSIAGVSTLAMSDSTDAMFSAPATTSTPAVSFFTNGTGCATSGLCTAEGTITLTFSQPVLNPVLHLTSLSGWAGRWPGGPNNWMNTTDASLIHPSFTLNSSSPAGATLGSPSSGAANLATTASTIDVTDPKLSTLCNTIVDPPTASTATSGCGSVPVQGIVSTLSFSVDLFYVIDKGAGWNDSASHSNFPPGDIYSLAVSFDEVPVTVEVTPEPTTAASAPVSAVPGEPTLATTGIPVAGLLAVALVLLTVGTVALSARSGRRRTP